MEDCLACGLTAGTTPLPGGRIWSGQLWLVEHCVGPLGVGTLIVKPFRHVEHVAKLTSDEADELGPVLRAACACAQELMAADQVYACLWSHAGWLPGHIHFVVQPIQAHMAERYPDPGPSLQARMFEDGETPEPAAVEAFCDRARDWFNHQAAASKSI